MALRMMRLRSNSGVGAYTGPNIGGFAMTLTERWARIRTIAEEAKAWRREMHRRPQTMYEETFASGLVVERLTEWGIPHETGFAGTGVVATIDGQAPAGHRLSRGHGCVGYCRRDGTALELDLSRQDARVRARWTHGYPACAGQISARDATLSRQGAAGVSTGRGGWSWSSSHDGRRTAGEVSV